MKRDKDSMSADAYVKVKDTVTKGGKQNATRDAEERIKSGGGMDPMVDPKGPPHLGAVRISLPRFHDEKENGFWILALGLPMPDETLLDTTGSMGGEVDHAFESLLRTLEMLKTGKKAVLDRYDLQSAMATFNDIEDTMFNSIPVLWRTQFEMGEKIAIQMAAIAPGRGGCGNGKEDPQFGLFGAVYLTKARINEYKGMKSYHHTVSDEPVVETIDLGWLKKIYGDNVLDQVESSGFKFDAENLPATAQVVKDLQTRAHAFFLQVGDRPDVKNQWTRLYGADHFVRLPRQDGTTYLHAVKATIIGLTEGTIDLGNAEDFLQQHNIPKDAAKRTVRAVAHIPIGAQTSAPDFARLPKAGDAFREKTDLWPVPEEGLAKAPKKGKQQKSGKKWL